MKSLLQKKVVIAQGICSRLDPMKTKADCFIDITSDICTITLVKVKLQLEKMESGQILEVRLSGEEPRESIPRALTETGFHILSLTPQLDGSATSTIRILCP